MKATKKGGMPVRTPSSLRMSTMASEKKHRVDRLDGREGLAARVPRVRVGVRVVEVERRVVAVADLPLGELRAPHVLLRGVAREAGDGPAAIKILGREGAAFEVARVAAVPERVLAPGPDLGRVPTFGVDLALGIHVLAPVVLAVHYLIGEEAKFSRGGMIGGRVARRSLHDISFR